MPSRPTASRDRRSTLDEVVERRREELAEGKREGVREYLGELPPDEERHIVLERFYGSGGGTSGAGMIRGTGASPGTAEGTARVVPARTTSAASARATS